MWGYAPHKFESVDETGQQIALAIVVMLSIIVAVALPLLTLWRVRTREQRRGEWLSANAQPRLTAIGHGFIALLSVGGALACALGAIAGYPFLWAPVALSAGVLVSTIVSAVVAYSTPAELD